MAWKIAKTVNKKLIEFLKIFSSAQDLSMENLCAKF